MMRSRPFVHICKRDHQAHFHQSVVPWSCSIGLGGLREGTWIPLSKKKDKNEQQTATKIGGLMCLKCADDDDENDDYP